MIRSCQPGDEWLLALCRPPALLVSEIINVLLYTPRSGVSCRVLPDCLAPRQIVRGWFAAFHDADKKIRRCKRHAMMDVDGRGLILHTRSADIQDREARFQ